MNKYRHYFVFLLGILLGGTIIYFVCNPKVFQAIMQSQKTWDLFITFLGNVIFALIVFFIVKKLSEGLITKMTNATLQAGEDLTNHVQGVFFKPVTSAVYASNQYKSKRDIKKDIVKISNANLFAVRVTSTFTRVSYFQLHDKNTLPILNDKPVLSFMIPSASNENPYILDIGINYFAPSIYFSNGISWIISQEQDQCIPLKVEGYYSVNISYL